MKNLPECESREIQNLLEVASGTQLILGALWEQMQGPGYFGQDEFHAVMTGLSASLRMACDPVDAYYFGDASAASWIPKHHIVTLLENQLTNLRKQLDQENAAKGAGSAERKRQRENQLRADLTAKGAGSAA